MRWEGQRQSENVEVGPRMGGRGVAVAGGGLGLGTVGLMLLVWFLGGDPAAVVPQGGGGGGDPAAAGDAEAGGPAASEKDREFVAVVLADTEDVWHDLFRSEYRAEYREPKLELFGGRVESACGMASAAVGPFYCPQDRQVYLDTEFFRLMQEKLHAPGDFARAYVIAHEVGHHVQNLLGLSEQVQGAQQRASRGGANKLSVRLELQADYLAGVWAHHAQKTKHILEQGDVEEALNCATSIGDDKLQREAQGYVVPDAFTHGTSAQRVAAFRSGLESGDFSKAALNRFFE